MTRWRQRCAGARGGGGAEVTLGRTRRPMSCVGDFKARRDHSVVLTVYHEQLYGYSLTVRYGVSYGTF